MPDIEELLEKRNRAAKYIILDLTREEFAEYSLSPRAQKAHDRPGEEGRAEEQSCLSFLELLLVPLSGGGRRRRRKVVLERKVEEACR
ncbi:hypothetical protein TNCV_5140061 [Trichonephila clavipes]|nr:hypothetical protein TNCV_5140061 [Trichonephila clavipes]